LVKLAAERDTTMPALSRPESPSFRLVWPRRAPDNHRDDGARSLTIAQQSLTTFVTLRKNVSLPSILVCHKLHVDVLHHLVRSERNVPWLRRSPYPQWRFPPAWRKSRSPCWGNRAKRLTVSTALVVPELPSAKLRSPRIRGVSSLTIVQVAWLL